MKQLVKPLRPQLCRHGVGGVVKVIDCQDHHPLTRLLLAADRRYVGLAQFARDWVFLEKQLESRSVPEMAREFFEYLALDLNTNQFPVELSEPDRPLILLGLNHESIIEPIVLVSLLNRNDLKFLGMKVFQYLGPRIAAYILPVLPRKVAVDYCGEKKPAFSDRLDLIYQLYVLENRTVDEIKELNRWSICQAAEHLCGGGALIIFPNGGRPIDRPWYRGIGEILDLLPPEVLSSMPIFPISIVGPSRKQLFQKVRQAVFSRRCSTSIQVNLFDPIYIAPEAASFSPEQILDLLKAKTEARRMMAKDGPGLVPTANYPRRASRSQVFSSP